MAGIRYWGKTGKNETYMYIHVMWCDVMYIHVMVPILKFRKLDKNNFNLLSYQKL